MRETVVNLLSLRDTDDFPKKVEQVTTLTAENRRCYPVKPASLGCAYTADGTTGTGGVVIIWRRISAAMKKEPVTQIRSSGETALRADCQAEAGSGHTRHAKPPDSAVISAPPNSAAISASTAGLTLRGLFS